MNSTTAQTPQTPTKTRKKSKKGKSALVKKQSDVGKSKTYGLMPSALDSLNHNVYYADAEAIRGARDTESALRYIPFVTIVNTAGFGQQFDLRGQGRLSAGGVKFLINGISFNPLDSYYGFMPINTILPTLTQEIALYPGLDARGGTVNVITSKRFDKPYFSVGAGYANNLATTGNTFNAHAQAAAKLGRAQINAGVGYFSKGGPREDESSTGGQAVLGGAFDFGWGQSISFDADFYTAKDKTTPYNSFWDSEKVGALFKEYEDKYKNKDEKDATQQRQELGAEYGKKILALPSYSPDKNDRKTKAQGELDITHQRFGGSLAYHSELTKKLKFDLTGFYAFDKREYNKHISTTLFYPYGARFFIGEYGNENKIDQSGSSFDEQKYGARAQINWEHDNGHFSLGVESIYEKAKRNPKQILETSKMLSSPKTDNSFQWFEFKLNTPLDISKWSNAIYLTENYKFSEKVALALGGRYENTKSKIEASGNIKGDFWNGGLDSPTNFGNGNTPISKSTEANHENFAVEVAPAFHYSDTGTIYGRYELGFSPVPAYAMLVRKGTFDLSKTAKLGANFTMEETNLKDERYHSFELGFKDYVPNRQIRLGNFKLTIDAILFSANAFYTQSSNEFYFTGDPYAGLNYATYDSSRRMGVEVALEQYFFNGALGFNESFTYLKAEQKAQGASEWAQIPYTYDYKATFGANADVASYFKIRGLSIDLWIQNSFYGKQAVVSSIDGEKLKPYAISDVGVSVGFLRNRAVLTAGVKNVFDTLYFDYYNHDKSASIGEYRYLFGQGRTIFVEGRFSY